MSYLNSTGVSISVAAWLAHDDYDYVTDPNYISVTTLIKPVKQIILANRLPEPEDMPKSDVISRYASCRGSAIHNSIEHVWKNHHDSTLKSIGIKKKIRDKIRVNPTEEMLKEAEDNGTSIIPVYMEQRHQKTAHGFTIGGKYDFVLEGYVEDFKTTSTYTYTKETNNEKQRLQGSLYRWLAPHIITQDVMKIQYLFTDWKAMDAQRDPNYPPQPIVEKRHQLYSMNDTTRYIDDKLIAIKQLADSPEEDMPPCTDEDLWRDADVYKYFKDPSKVENGVPKKGSRSTKNFTNELDAMGFRQEKGGVGTIVTVKGKVKACKYCNVAIICRQKDAYLADGSLEL